MANENTMVTVNEDKTLTIGLDLLNKIIVRNGNRNALQPNQILELVPTDKTEDVDGQDFPVFSIGSGQELNLNVLGNFYLVDDGFGEMIANKGEAEECLKRSAKPTTLKEWMIAQEGVIPSTLKVVSRTRSGAQKEFLDGNKGATRKVGYKLLNLDTSKENFPVIWCDEDKDPKQKENWRFFERIAVQAAS